MTNSKLDSKKFGTLKINVKQAIAVAALKQEQPRPQGWEDTGDKVEKRIGSQQSW